MPLITSIDIFRYSIPMVPFTISTGTMHFAQNLFLRIHTDAGFYGVGECSAFPMIAGETQNTCMVMAQDMAPLWIGKEATDIAARMNELHAFAAHNATIKSAFDMALYDIAAKAANLPLYAFMGGTMRTLETDLTLGIDSPENMAKKAVEFIASGVRFLKVKLGKNAAEDVKRIQLIRAAIGPDIAIRIDANQGWSFEDALFALQAMGPLNIQFCEQPMRTHNDYFLPVLREQTPIPIMADESVCDHHDAARLIAAKACDYVNIKFAKSGGMLEAAAIVDTCTKGNTPCMMGGMLESRLALTAQAHFTLAHPHIIFYDMDTVLLGHTADPVTGGITYKGYVLDVPQVPGIGADVDEGFLATCEKLHVKA